MARSPHTPDQDRRIPRQRRAQDSCAAIFDAAAQILQQDGMAGLSTNRIAERAGLSIGTLYQYFPNKQAVLLAMGLRDIEALRVVVAKELLAAAAVGETPYRRVIDALLVQFTARRPERWLVVETMFSQHLDAELAAALELGFRSQEKAMPAARAFVLTRAIMGVLHGVVMSEAALDPAQLEDELLALAQGYAAA